MARVLSLSGRLPSKRGSIHRSLFLFQERLMSQSKRTKWSAEVTAHSDALDLEPHVLSKEDPSEIAESLKRSAESSDRRKSGPFRSAMSMLNLYINRAGRNLSPSRKRTLERAKTKFRGLFGRKT
jgi:Protein of unknown function (DUF3175)